MLELLFNASVAMPPRQLEGAFAIILTTQSARRHWQALLVSILFMWRLSRGDFESNLLMSIAVGLAIVGMVMNLAVILINREMPARVTPEEISEEERPHYHPISPSTRLVILSDWIPLANLLVSPGDIVLFVAAGILLVEATVGF